MVFQIIPPPPWSGIVLILPMSREQFCTPPSQTTFPLFCILLNKSSQHPKLCSNPLWYVRRGQSDLGHLDFKSEFELDLQRKQFSLLSLHPLTWNRDPWFLLLLHLHLHLGNIMLHQGYWCELSEVHWMELLKYAGCRANCYSSTQVGLQSSRACKVLMGNPSLDAFLDIISSILIIFTLNGVHYSCKYK